MEQFIITKTSAGTYEWECPERVYSLTVELIGGGAPGVGSPAGSTQKGGGGSGGQYVIKTITVTPGTNYSYVVASARSGTSGNGSNGYDSSFGGSIVLAKGGIPGNGTTGGIGSTSGGIGDIVYSGGNGANAGTNPGGGGGGAGTSGNGNNAILNEGGTSKSQFGGAGGDGGINNLSHYNGYAGSSAGGGGGGAWGITPTFTSGGAGAIGFSRLTYTQEDPYRPSYFICSSVDPDILDIYLKNELVARGDKS